MTPEERKVFNEAIEAFGEYNQIGKTIEELSELLVAVCNDDMDNIVEELADVSIMLDQMGIILKDTVNIFDSERKNKFDHWRKFKVDRLKNRIAERSKK